MRSIFIIWRSYTFLSHPCLTQNAPNKYNQSFFCSIDEFERIETIISNKPFVNDSHVSNLLGTQLVEPMERDRLEAIVTPESLSNAIVEKARFTWSRYFQSIYCKYTNDVNFFFSFVCFATGIVTKTLFGTEELKRATAHSILSVTCSFLLYLASILTICGFVTL